MRIALFWNYLFHYRVPFYERLEKVPGVDLTVFHGGEDPNRPVPSCRLSQPVSFESIPIKTREKAGFGAVVYFQSGMWKHLLTRHFDVIVCEGNFGILSNVLLALYSRLTRTRFLYWVAGFQRGAIRGFPARLRRAYIRAVCRTADGYLCYGSEAERFLASYGATGPCTIIQNTVDTEAIEASYERQTVIADRMKRALGLFGKTVLLSVGVQVPKKKTELLIEAYRLLRASRDDLALVIVGDGPLKQQLVSQVESQAISDVVFAGEVIDDVGAYFLMADIFVLPGLGGLAINEAMAYGLPVVCAEGDGTEKDLVVPGVTGVLFRRDDAPDLANKIQALLSDPDNVRRMGTLARQHVYKVASMSCMLDRFVSAVLPSPESRLA
jgi:glycosyltransferase involved in cell wall biosynthesis